MAGPAAADQFVAGVEFQLTNFGELERQLQRTNDLFKGIGAQATTAGSQVGASASDQVSAMWEVRHAGQTIEGMGLAITDKLLGLGQQFVETGSAFETTRIGFQQVFGDYDLAAEKFDASLAIAEKTSLRTLDVLNSTVGMQRLNVDALKTYNKEILVAGNMETQRLSGLELINDLITGSQQQASRIFPQINKAIGGQQMAFKALFDGLEDEEDRRAYKSAKTTQERADAIFIAINKLYGGIAASTKDTFGFLLANLGDVMTNIKGMVGERLMPILTPVLKLMFDFLQGIKENEQFLTAVADAFGTMAKAGVWMATHLIAAASAMRDFIAEHPQVAKFGLIFTAMAGSALVLFGKLVRLSTALQSFTLFVLPALKTGFIGIGSSLAAALPIIAALAAAVALVAVAWNENFGGIQEKVETFKLALTGLWQIVSSFSGGAAELDEGTAQALEDAGLLDTVASIGFWIGNVKESLMDAFTFIRDNWYDLVDAIMPVIEPLWDLIMLLGETTMRSMELFFGTLFEGTDVAEGKILNVESAWGTIVDVLARVAEAIAWVVEGVTDLMIYLQPVRDFFAVAMAVAIKHAWGVLTGAFAILKDNILPPVIKIFTTLWGVVTRLWDGIVKVGTLIATIFGPVLEALGIDLSSLTEGFDWLAFSIEYALIPLRVLGWALEGFAFALDLIAGSFAIVYDYFISPLLWAVTKGWELFWSVLQYVNEELPLLGSFLSALVSPITTLIYWINIALDKLEDLGDKVGGVGSTLKDIGIFVASPTAGLLNLGADLIGGGEPSGPRLASTGEGLAGFGGGAFDKLASAAGGGESGDTGKGTLEIVEEMQTSNRLTEDMLAELNKQSESLGNLPAGLGLDSASSFGQMNQYGQGGFGGM